MEQFYLWYIIYMPYIMAHRLILMMLVERWHSETSTFYLHRQDIIIILEDVWMILQILIHGYLIYYQFLNLVEEVERFFRNDLPQNMLPLDMDVCVGLVKDLPLVLVSLVNCLLLLKRLDFSSLVAQSNVWLIICVEIMHSGIVLQRPPLRNLQGYENYRLSHPIAILGL